MVKMKWTNYLFWWGSQHNSILTSGVIVTWALLNLAVVNPSNGQTYCEDKPKILYYRRGQAALVSGASDEVANHVVISNVNKEFLACVSSRNVEWVYEGDGEPSKFQESSTVDIQKYEDGSISYCLTSQITFYNKQSDTELSRHTGRYTCREIGNVSNTASVYLFTSRKNSPTFLQSRKTLILPLGAANITTVPMKEGISSNNGSSGSSKGRNKIVPTRAFTIPCVTTSPDVITKLYKKAKNNKFVLYTGAAHQFDPKYGFQLNASTLNPEDLSEFYGEYKCVSSPIAKSGSGSGSGGKSIEELGTSQGRNVEDFVLVTLVKAKSLKVFPPVSEVYISGMLNLTCESEEPVIMKEVLPPSAQDVYSYLDEDDYARDRSDDIVETTEKTEQKSHVANYMEIAPAPGRTGEIQCLSEKSGKVLHTWKYRIIRKRADKLSGIKFNKREQSFTCKSKLGAPGRLSFVSCRTPSECRINRNCLLKSENCRGYSNSTRAFCERKTHFCGKIFYKGGSGLIRCIGEGIDEIRGFTDESVTDQVVRMGFGKLKASETALLQLAQDVDDQGQKYAAGVKTGNPAIYEGDTVNVTLRMGYYFFLYPVQWSAKFRNGSTVEISTDSQTLQVDRLTRTVMASLTLPYTSATKFVSTLNNTSGSGNRSESETGPSSTTEGKQPSEIVALNALIPLRSSVDPSWKTISLPLTVYGKEGLLQPPTDLESDEVLVEPPLHSQKQPESEPVQPSLANKEPDSDKNGTTGESGAQNEDDNDEDDENDEDENEEAEEEEQQNGTTPASFNQPTSETISIDSKLSPTQTEASKDNATGSANEAPTGKAEVEGDPNNQNMSITTTISASSSPTSSTTPAADLEAAVSHSPGLSTSGIPNDDAHSHEAIIGKAQDETLLARSGLLDEGEFNENAALQAETQIVNQNQGESEVVVVEVHNQDEPLPTTGQPTLNLSKNDEVFVKEENDDVDQISFTTEQGRLARFEPGMETTTTFPEVEISS